MTEVSHQELHQMANRALVVEVDDPDRGAALLADKLAITTVEKSGAGTLVITEAIDAPEAVAQVIVESGLKLYSLHKQEMTLEEYFMQLVGGNKDV